MYIVWITIQNKNLENHKKKSQWVCLDWINLYKKSSSNRNEKILQMRDFTTYKEYYIQHLYAA